MENPGSEDQSVHWWRPACLPGVEILEGRNCSQKWKVFHETYSICQIWDIQKENYSQWRYRGRKLISRAGGFMMMEPGETHVTEKISGPGDFWVLLLDPARFGGFFQKGFLRGMPHLREVDSRCPRFFLAMKNLYASLTGHSSLLEKESRLCEVKRLFLETFSEAPPIPPLDPGRKVLREARDYIKSHFKEEIKLETLAEIPSINLNPFYFNRFFKKHFGITPKQYQGCLRVAKAKEELAKGSPIWYSAESAGFCNSSHLDRVFKDFMLITPSEYQFSVTRRRGRQ